MISEADKIERIEMSKQEIEKGLGSFFQRHYLVCKQSSEKGFIYGNDTYNLNFSYAPERYFWFIFQDLLIEIKGKIYNFRDIIYFMQKERKEENIIDTYKELRPFSTYEKYLESHFIPFLEIENNIEKMDAYMKDPKGYGKSER